jgi:hypothetical protein
MIIFCPSHLAIITRDRLDSLTACWWRAITKNIRNHTFFGFENDIIFDDESDETRNDKTRRWLNSWIEEKQQRHEVNYA